MRWVAESISATQQALDDANKINIPILIVQAGSDTIVNNLEQKQFFNKVTHCKDKQFLNIPGAKHELLLEQDQYRIPALNKALQFLKQSQQDKLHCIK
jgi:lysophospholipase